MVLNFIGSRHIQYMTTAGYNCGLGFRVSKSIPVIFWFFFLYLFLGHFRKKRIYFEYAVRQWIFFAQLPSTVFRGSCLPVVIY